MVQETMRVLILTTSFPAYNGHHQSPFIYELAKHLAKKHEVHVVCPHSADSKGFKMDGFYVHRFRYMVPSLQTLTEGGGIPTNLKRSIWAWIQLPFFIASMYLKASRVAKSKGIEIIHAQWALSGLVGKWLKCRRHIPLILTTRGAAVNMAMKSCPGRKVLKGILRSCDHITPNNEPHAVIFKKMGFKNVRAIPNGIATDRFKPGDKTLAKSKLGVDGKNVLFIGWLIERKGLRYLIEAMKGIDATLAIVGDGPQHEEMLELAKSIKVKFYGNRKPSDVPLYMNAADVLVLPSLSEGRPNVIGEAMASGVPVIATRIPGNSDLIKDGISGLLVEPRDIKGLNLAINRILKDGALKNKLVKNGKLAVKGMSWDACASEYGRIYKTVMIEKS